MKGVRLVNRSRLLQDAIRWLGSILRDRVELIVDVCAQHIQVGPQVGGALSADHGGGPGCNILGTNVRKNLRIETLLAIVHQGAFPELTST